MCRKTGSTLSAFAGSAPHFLAVVRSVFAIGSRIEGSMRTTRTARPVGTGAGDAAAAAGGGGCFAGVAPHARSIRLTNAILIAAGSYPEGAAEDRYYVPLGAV